MKRRSALALFAAAVATACTESKPQFKSIDLTGADYARDFQLPDADGQVRSLKDFAGKIVVVFFGYTQCPDVCPTTLGTQVTRQMGFDIVGREGVLLSEHWADGMRSKHGMHIHGFPNLFLVQPTQGANLISNVPHNLVESGKTVDSLLQGLCIDHPAQQQIFADQQRRGGSCRSA